MLERIKDEAIQSYGRDGWTINPVELRRFQIIAQAQLEDDKKKLYDWGNELCPHFAPTNELKRCCFDCWQELIGEGK